MPGHARRFPGCSYGPMALRPLLRVGLQPGERVVGFGAADTAGPGWRALTLLAPALPIGWIWSTRLLRRRRVIVFTDRRLVVLSPDRPTLDPRAIRWNVQVPLSQVVSARLGPRTVRVETPAGVFIARLRGRWSGSGLSTGDPPPENPVQAR